MNSTSNTKTTHSERALTITSAITTVSEITINHAQLGTEAWEWDAREQADFLAAFALQIRGAGLAGLMQLNYIADKLTGTANADVQWLLETLTEHLDNEPDGAPITQSEVTSGYVNPSQERMAAWEQKQALRR